MKYRIYMETEKARSVYHKVNQDRMLFSRYSFMEDKEIRLLVVADGMGGLENGEKASSDAVKGFVKAFYEKMAETYISMKIDCFSASYFAEEMEEVVREAIAFANKEVCEQADPLVETGTTISVVCIVDDYAIVANVGDSPIYFYRAKKNKLELVSKLHTQAELDVEAGLYERYSMEYYENDHRIYSSLGQYMSLNEEYINSQIIGYLEEGDLFLIGSDGAFGALLNMEILELITMHSDEEDEIFLLPRLFDRAILDKDDDQTAILYIISEE